MSDEQIVVEFFYLFLYSIANTYAIFISFTNNFTKNLML